jgi:hypothetical protein
MRESGVLQIPTLEDASAFGKRAFSKRAFSKRAFSKRAFSKRGLPPARDDMKRSMDVLAPPFESRLKAG